MAVFKFLGSKQIRTDPSFLATARIPSQLVRSDYLVSTHLVKLCFHCFLLGNRHSSLGIRNHRLNILVELNVVYSPGKQPIP